MKGRMSRRKVGDDVEERERSYKEFKEMKRERKEWEKKKEEKKINISKVLWT
ncbi:MAG: hypothetical protein Q8755_03320 [Candidatus Phytoplasma australasiaticum]|nr:hypothetical protein [Candidatus Phytoplasma australasiaticum]